MPLLPVAGGRGQVPRVVAAGRRSAL